MEIHPGLDVVTIAKTCLLFRLGEFLTRIIPPATFSEKRVPDGNFLVAGPTATGEAPFEDFLIRPALQCSLHKLVVIYSEKSRATRVEVSRVLDTGEIFGRQFAGGL